MSAGFKSGRWGVGLAMAGLIWLSAVATSQAQGKGYALFVGIDRYLPSYVKPNLNGCVNDAITLRAKLAKDPARWSRSRMTLLRDSAATESAIKLRLSNRARALVAGDIFVYYQASHGKHTGRKAKLCTYKSDFTDAELGRALAKFRSGVKIFVILDTCYSGGMFKSGKRGNFVENVLHAYKEAGAKAGDKAKSIGANIAFMTGADYNQFSDEDLGSGHGYYTKYLLEACNQPKADVTPRDGWLTFWEAHSYAKPRTTAAAAAALNDIQTPQHWNKNQLYNYILMSVRVKAPVTIGPTSSFSPVRPTFSWKAVEGALYYRVLVNDSSGRSIIQQTNIRALSWTPSSDLPKGRYTWKMSAFSYAQNQGPFSQTKAFAVNDDSNPPPPGGSYLRRISLTWNASCAYVLDPVMEMPNWNPLVQDPIREFDTTMGGSSNSPPYLYWTVNYSNPTNCVLDVYGYMPCGSYVYRFIVEGEYGIYDCSFSKNGARVTVQSPTSTLYTFTPPTPIGYGNYWHVFNMTCNGTIIPVNIITPNP